MPLDTATQDRIAKRAEHLHHTLTTLRKQLAERQDVKGEAKDIPSVRVERVEVAKYATRPTSLDDMVGQQEVTMQLRTVIAGARLRGTDIPHVLLTGPPGFGKTSLAQIIGSEVDAPVTCTTGMVVKKVADLVGLLVRMNGGPHVLFIDEIHTLPKVVQECLYTVLEDKKIDILSGSGPDAEASTQPLPHLVIVGATTEPGKLTVPFRDRFGVNLTMQSYTDDELSQIVDRFWKSRNVKCFKGEALQVALRSKGVPRRAITLATRVLDYMAVSEARAVTTGMVAEALEVFGIDHNGLDKTDYKILAALTTNYVGKTVGLDSLSSFLDIDQATLSQQHEPYLVRKGLLLKTGRGRTASAAAYELMRED